MLFLCDEMVNINGSETASVHMFYNTDLLHLELEKPDPLFSVNTMKIPFPEISSSEEMPELLLN